MCEAIAPNVVGKGVGGARSEARGRKRGDWLRLRPVENEVEREKDGRH